MADLFTEIRNHLLTNSNINDVVGRDEQGRIFPKRIKDRCQLPAIAINVFTGNSAEGLSGSEDIDENRVQIDCYARTVDQADQLMKLVNGLLRPKHSSFRGTIGGIYVHSIVAVGSPRHGDDPPIRGDHEFRHWQSQDFMVTWNG